MCLEPATECETRTAGFTSLPPELQRRILILAKQQGSDPGGSRDRYGAPQVCRAWDAHCFLHACTAVYTPTAGSMAHEAANLRALAMLPYSHAVQTISSNDFHAPFVTTILGAMLTAPSLALLRLRTLSLRVARSSDMAIALAAAEAAPQLTALALSNHWHPANVGQHVVMLPRLPQLRPLDLGVPLPDDESPGVLAVDMSSLSTMRQLTFLSLDLNILCVADPCLHSLTTSMLQVGESLRTLTALRPLNLACWTCECVADALPSWCALASALPNLAHLTDLRMLHLRMPDDPMDASHLETLAFALPALSSLRPLEISSYGNNSLVRAQLAAAAHREGSERLARAIGALTHWSSHRPPVHLPLQSAALSDHPRLLPAFRQPCGAAIAHIGRPRGITDARGARARCWRSRQNAFRHAVSAKSCYDVPRVDSSCGAPTACRSPPHAVVPHQILCARQ